MEARIPLVVALIITVLALVSGCKGDTGPAGPAGPSGSTDAAVTVPSNSQPPTDGASAAWAALEPTVTVQSVIVGGAPKVTFTVTDAAGKPIVGLGNTSKGKTAAVAGLTNLAFSIAKLVPGSNGSPSKWVSYIVMTVPTLAADGGTVAAAPNRPTTDNSGTLVDNGDGTYVYTFYLDITQLKAQVDGLTVSGSNDKADLGDLTYDPSLVHRVAIQLSGAAPGTGTNTPDGVQKVAGVQLLHAVDAIYDFNPGTGQAVASSGRELVTTANCDTCHQVLGGVPGDSPEASGAGFHGGNRNDVRYCVVCHTEQRKYGRTEATFDAATLTFTSQTYRVFNRAIGNLPNEIHKIHMGSLLARKDYNFAGLLFNETLFPQDVRNCNKCHDATNPATPQASNWMNVPSRLACGACHDGIDFATGHGVTLADAAKGLTKTTTFDGFAHGGLQQPDDSQCATCHSSGRVDVDTSHLPVTPPDPGNALLLGGTNSNTNAAWIASNPARKPAGAFAVSYDIKNVSVDGSGHPVMVFRILQDGQRKDLNDFATATSNPATGQKEIWNNFMGAPSLYFVFAVPQDGFNTPADFNATVSGYLRTLWNGSATGSGAGTLTGPDGAGYYTGTLTGVTIPASAVMLTGGLGFSYGNTSTLPLTQTNLPNYPVGVPTAQSPAVVSCAASTTNACRTGGLVVVAPNAEKVATGFTGRRAIVENARCDKCHQELGTFTQDAFHAGQRNDGTTCAWCHNPNKTSNGWAADSTAFVHAIHASAKRQVPFNWDASSTTESFAEIKYPGVLNFCEGCHIPGAYNFSNSDSQAALPNRLYRTVATGTFAGHVDDTVTTYAVASGTCNATQSAPQTALGVFMLSPYVAPAAPGTNTPNYGSGFAFNAGLTPSKSCKPDGTLITNPPGGTVQADSVTLVTSPVTSACFSCHDSSDARAHFEINGGSVYAPRSTALNRTETCLVCHGPGRIADIAEVHAQ